MALNLTTETRAHYSSKQLWVINGVWTFQEAARHQSVSQDTARRDVREGELRARQEPTPQGYAWRVELLEDAHQGKAHTQVEEVARAELSHLERVLNWSSFTQPDSFSGAPPSAGSRIKAVKESEHKELMAVLREKLEAQYGHIAELHVLFQQRQSLRQHLERESWWQRVWRRFLK